MKTDQEVAASILRAKHVPQAPAVREESGCRWAPRVDEWREYVLALTSWLGTLDPEQALTVRRILSDWSRTQRHGQCKRDREGRWHWDQF